MQTWTNHALPREELRRLEFMVGEFTSWQTMFPDSDRTPVQYRSVLRAHREGCDRFLRMEQFSDVPGIGLVSTTSLFSFNSRDGVYQCYGFCSAHEEPLRYLGRWEAGRLIMISNPVAGYSGLNRFRQTITPKGQDRWDFLQERWDLTGFVKHVAGSYLLCPI